MPNVEAWRHGADRCGSTRNLSSSSFGPKMVFSGWLRGQSGA